jgi:hypothetical protein
MLRSQNQREMVNYLHPAEYTCIICYQYLFGIMSSTKSICQKTVCKLDSSLVPPLDCVPCDPSCNKISARDFVGNLVVVAKHGQKIQQLWKL